MIYLPSMKVNVPAVFGMQHYGGDGCGGKHVLKLTKKAGRGGGANFFRNPRNAKYLWLRGRAHGGCLLGHGGLRVLIGP